jgi:hypothetical protein
MFSLSDRPWEKRKSKRQMDLKFTAALRDARAAFFILSNQQFCILRKTIVLQWVKK